jgi:multiple antibiotic resistance protein
MVQKFFVAFIPVFVAIDPIGLVAIYMGLASSASPEQRKRQASLGIFTAFCVAIGFVFLGQVIFDALGITDADFQVAGGPAMEAAMNSELSRLECR